MTNNKDSLHANGSSLKNKTLTLGAAKTCRYCAKPIQWHKNSAGKFAPIEPATGRDHRETCHGIAPTTRTKLRDSNHESAVKSFYRSLGAL